MKSRNVTTQRQTGFDSLTVGELMERHVKYGHPQTKADVLASMMIEGFGAVPIVDDKQRLVGIVSEFDLLAALRRGKNWNELSAEELMTKHPAFVGQDTGVTTLIGVMQASHFIRMPVVDSAGKLVGIVARRDVIRGCLNCEASFEGQRVTGYW